MEAPIVDRLAPYLRPGDAEPVQLAPEGSKVAADALRQLHGQPELIGAIESLALFACWLIELQGSPSAGRALLKVAHAEIPALSALGAEAAQVAHELRSAVVSGHYARVTGGRPLDNRGFAEPPPPDAVVARPWTVRSLKPKRD